MTPENITRTATLRKNINAREGVLTTHRDADRLSPGKHNVRKLERGTTNSTRAIVVKTMTGIITAAVMGCITVNVQVRTGDSVKNSRYSRHYEQVPKANIPRSTFDLSRSHKTTINTGWLVPIFADEILPGDTFNVRGSIFARLATPIAPIMDNLYLDIHYFFVPNRLIWDNWQRFCGEQLNPGDSVDFLVPQVTLDMANIPAPPDPASTSGLFYNYLGIPTLNGPLTPTLTFSNLWGRAYNLIYREFYRDQNIIDSPVVDLGDGPDNPDNYFIRTRAKRRDYFTSCLPWPQKDAGVSIPIAGMAQVIGESGGSGQYPTFNVQGGGSASALNVGAAGTDQPVRLANSASPGLLSWADPRLVVDLSSNSGTINSLRTAFQIQRFLERDARGGTRYIEKLFQHFGVSSPDARLQRPEYLGGGTIPVNIHQVEQTSGTAPTQGGYSDTPQGNLAAYGIAAGTNNGFTKSFVEHGVLLGLISVRADITYQQGLHKMFSRRTMNDHYWPAFQGLGEQAVLNKEIYWEGDADPNANGVFGYQERWSEYKSGKSLVTGQLQSQYPQPLDLWHLAEDFETLPTLSQTFIESKPPIERCIAVQTAPHFIVDSYFKVKAARPMPVFCIPGMADHF